MKILIVNISTKFTSIYKNFYFYVILLLLFFLFNLFLYQAFLFYQKSLILTDLFSTEKTLKDFKKKYHHIKIILYKILFQNKGFIYF